MSDDAVTNFIRTPLTSAEDVLGQWRERLLYILLRVGLIAGLFALLANIVADIQIQDWVDIGIISVVYLVLMAITFLRMSYRLRASLLSFLLYALVVNSLLTSGIRGDGTLFAVIFSVLTLMLLGVRAGWISLGITLLTVAAAGSLVVTHNITLNQLFDQGSATVWIALAFVMLLVSMLLFLGVILLQREFLAAQMREKGAMDELLKDREQLETRVSERTRELSLAADVGRSVSQLHDLDTLLPKAVELIRSQYNLYYAQIYLTDASGRILTLRAGTGGVGAELLRRGHRLTVGPGSINGMAAADKKAVIVADTAASTIFRSNPLLPETRSELAVPLLVGERVVGVLDLQSRQPGALSPENLPVFAALAGQLAVALDNAALFAQNEQARQEVEQQTRRLTQTGWQEFLNGLERSERIGYLYDQNMLTPFNTPLPETLGGNSMKSSIVVTGAPIGAIQIERVGDQPWHQEEADLVTSVVDQAARQIENLRLLAQAETYRIEAESAASRLTREGWKEYLQTKQESSGYVYDQTQVQPEVQSRTAGTAQPADQPVKAVVQPLQIGREIVGELAFDGIDGLDADSQELVGNVANLLSSHIEELRLTEQTQKALIQTEELYSSSAQVVRSSTIEEVLRSVIETTSLHRFDRASFIFFDQPWVDEAPVNGYLAGLWSRIGEELPVPAEVYSPLRHTPMAQVLRRDEPVVIPDVMTDTRLNDQQRSTLVKTGRSLVYYPLVAGDTWFGFLSVASDQPVHMTDEEIRPTQTLVGQAATVIQSIRLLQEAQTRAQREQALRQITSAVRGSTNADTILRTATRELGTALGRIVKVQLGSVPNPSAASPDSPAGDGVLSTSEA